MKSVLKIAAATMAVAAMASPAFAADEISAAPVYSAASPWTGYVKAMGGVTLADTLDWDQDPYDTDRGYAVGAAVGLNLPVDGLSAEVDALFTRAAYTGQCLPGGCYSNSVSLMGNIVYTANVTDRFALYGGAGAGLVRFSWSYEGVPEESDAGYGLGYQVFAGAQASITEKLAATLEIRHQAGAQEISISTDNPAYDAEYKRTMVLAGFRFAFN